jgi:hypothetical protein
VRWILVPEVQRREFHPIGPGAEPLSTAGEVSILVGAPVTVARTLDVWLSAPVDVMRWSHPTDVLRSARISALAKGVVGALAMGIAFGIGRGFATGVAAGLSAGASRMLVSDLEHGLRKVGLAAWSRFALARLWLAGRGHLPWRTMAFLRDAHQRHVLWQAGPVYQFRHLRLHDALDPSAFAEYPSNGAGVPVDFSQL